MSAALLTSLALVLPVQTPETSLSAAGVELTASSFVRNKPGRTSGSASVAPCRRTTWHGPHSGARLRDRRRGDGAGDHLARTSVLVMAEARQKGHVEFKVRNYPDRRDNPGTLRRVGQLARTCQRWI